MIIHASLQFPGEIRKPQLALARSGAGCREPRNLKSILQIAAPVVIREAVALLNI